MSISREVLAKYIKPGCVFVETGSRWGDTCIRAIELGAKLCWTCESDSLMAGIAQAHVNDATKGAVFVLNVDSKCFLMDGFHVWGRRGDIIVYLDAHTETSSPVMEELLAIDHWGSKPAVILIDDMRCMNDWKVSEHVLCGRLEGMGYRLSREDGVVKGDILVARL